MCILRFPLAFLLRKEYLNNISFMELLVCVTLVHSILAIKNKTLQNIIIMLECICAIYIFLTFKNE